MEGKYFLCMVLAHLAYVTCTTNVLCSIRPEVISTSKKDGEKRDPAHIILNRCSGGVRGRYFRCLSIETKNVSITFAMHGGKNVDEIFVSHTKCKERCVCGSCDGKEPYEPICEGEMKWNVSKCKCIMPEETKGHCVYHDGNGGEGKISVMVFVVSLIIEFVAVLIIVFLVMDACRYRKQSEGVIYRTTKFVRQISSGENENFSCSTLKRDRDTSGSVTLLYDIKNGNIPNGKVAV